MKIKQELTKRTRLKHPKRVIIITLAALLLIALGVYTFLSYQNWTTLQQRSQDATSSLKKAVDSSLGAESPAEDPAAQIDTIIAHFNKTYGTNPCDISNAYSWQTILPAIKEIKTNCATRSATAIALIDTLKPLSQFLKDQKSASALIAANIEATKNPSDYAAAATLWQDTTKLSETASFKPVADKIKEVTASISAAYAALAAASKAEDKAAFDTAISAFQTAYATIPNINTVATETQTALITKAVEAYEKL